MNFFSHAHRFLDDPYFVAGTAVPDWLSVLNRKVRARSRDAAMLLDDEDLRVRSLVQGIIQHHYDDAWFHQTEAFYRVTAKVTRLIRERHPNDSSMRSGFVGHVIVELLLDDSLIREDPDRLERYYSLFQQVDPSLIEATVSRISRLPADRLAILIPRFVDERFLYDYRSDERLLWRMNHVLKRVGLEPLPIEDNSWIQLARQWVDSNRHLLLEGEEKERAAIKILLK